MLFCHSASRIKAITFVPGGVSFTLIGNRIATVEINDNFRLTTVIASDRQGVTFLVEEASA
jgi:hypothetical protein